MLTLILLYTALGTLFTPFFFWRGLSALDPAARGASLAFHLLIAPGCIALWPVLALRWRQNA